MNKKNEWKKCSIYYEIRSYFKNILELILSEKRLFNFGDNYNKN